MSRLEYFALNFWFYIVTLFASTIEKDTLLYIRHWLLHLRWCLVFFHDYYNLLLLFLVETSWFSTTLRRRRFPRHCKVVIISVDTPTPLTTDAWIIEPGRWYDIKRFSPVNRQCAREFREVNNVIFMRLFTRGCSLV